jgi:hypothetical protein
VAELVRSMEELIGKTTGEAIALRVELPGDLRPARGEANQI